MSQAQVTPALMSWSRQRAGLTQADLAKSLPVKAEKVAEWEAGVSQPTFRQAQHWAQLAHIPFGFLYLKTPPTDQLPLPDLRTVAGTNTGNSNASVDLLDTVKDALKKQAWYHDYQKEQEQAPLPFVGRFSVTASVAEVAADIASTLQMQIPSKPMSAEEYLRELVEHADAAGILVFRSGIVGNNTRRKLDVGEFRGFAISDPLAPLVFINSADAPAARIFTLMHELAHLWIGSSGISNLTPKHSRREEIFCNAVAGELLAPEQQFRAAWHLTENWTENLPALANLFHVSQFVIARRACDLDYISTASYQEFYLKQLAQFRQQKGGGGDFYRSAGVKNGQRLTHAVLSEAFSGRMMLRDAGQLLGIQPAKLHDYANKVGP